jgi:protoporphyrinogen oxidase
MGGQLKTAILGGGLTGLTLSYLLNQKGIFVEVLEKEKVFGGLMRTLRKDGFTFDFGGSHVIFSKHKKSLDFIVKLLGDNKVRQKRNAKVLYKTSFVNYPFENGLVDLPKKENFECLYAFIENLLAKEKGKLREPRNLKEWFFFTFGKGIAKKYLIPYNEKIWKHSLEDLTLEWVERIPNPPVADIV